MSKTTIREVYARQVFSGRGHPAVEATVVTESGKSGTVQCTAGVSIGSHEVEFAYDGGDRWRGKGVMCAVDHVNDIIGPAILGMDAMYQSAVDDVILNLKGENTKQILGGNATAAVSAAVLKAASLAEGIPLYEHIGGCRAVTLPCAAYGAFYGSNRYTAGLQSGSKPTYSFVAYDFPTFSEASFALWEVCSHWWEYMAAKWGLRPSESSHYFTAGGMVNIPSGIVDNDFQLWDRMAEIISQCGYENKIGFQVDVASDTFYDPDNQTYEGLFCKGVRSREEQIAMIIEMCEKWPFVIVEDPLHEEDYEGHAILTRETGIQIVGDDLFTTDPKRLEEGVKVGAANTILLKVNQIGTISEALEMIQVAGENGYGVMPCSSRGENIDICDYSVGINAGTIRESGLGSPGNRFRQIEMELGNRAKFAGKGGLMGKKIPKGWGGERTMSGAYIRSIQAWEAFSDCGTPALQVVVETENKSRGTTLCAVGASKCTHETGLLCVSGDPLQEVALSVQNIRQILAPALVGEDCTAQGSCDAIIESFGSEHMGRTAAYALSAAILKAGAAEQEIPLYAHIGGRRAFTLPVPSMLAASGSIRYGGVPNACFKPTYAFVSYRFPTFEEASYALWEVDMNWKDMLRERLGVKMTTDAGMCIPPSKLENDYVLWDMMAEVIAASGYEGRIGLQADLSATNFYDPKNKTYRGLFCTREKSREDMIELALKMSRDYPFVILEDPLEENDFDGFAELTRRSDIQIVGDEIYGMNPKYLKKGVDKKAGNTVLVKPSQAGTITNLLRIEDMLRREGLAVMPCGSRGEGVDICDFAVGMNCGTVREPGIAYHGNRYLQIERELKRARFLGARGIQGKRFQIGGKGEGN